MTPNERKAREILDALRVVQGRWDQETALHNVMTVKRALDEAEAPLRAENEKLRDLVKRAVPLVEWLQELSDGWPEANGWRADARSVLNEGKP